DSKSNLSRAWDEVSKVNERDVPTKEEGVLDPRWGHCECERACSGTVPQQVRFAGRDASARLDVFRPRGQRESMLERVIDQDRPAVRVRSGGTQSEGTVHGIR